MSKNFPFEVLKAEGSNFDVGFQIGKKFKDRIKNALKLSQLPRLTKKKHAYTEKKFDGLHDFAKKYFPQYLEEIAGMAQGSCQDFKDLALLNFMSVYGGCSTVVFRRDDRIIVGHNEDGSKVNKDNSYLLIVKPKNNVSFFSFCYPGELPGGAFSFNVNGIVTTGNAMPRFNDIIGVPRTFLDRSLLEAKTIEDAIRRALFPYRTSGFSYNIASMKEKRAVNLETTPKEHYLTEIDDRFFHTNHYVSVGLKKIRQDVGKSSLRRYREGTRMIKRAKEKTSEGVLKILSSRANKPYSIFAKGGEGCSWTFCTALFEVSDEINLRVYPPLQKKNQYMKFSLNSLD
jgi:hypothetical protein